MGNKFHTQTLFLFKKFMQDSNKLSNSSECAVLDSRKDEDALFPPSSLCWISRSVLIFSFIFSIQELTVKAKSSQSRTNMLGGGAIHLQILLWLKHCRQSSSVRWRCYLSVWWVRRNTISYHAFRDNVGDKIRIKEADTVKGV